MRKRKILLEKISMDFSQALKSITIDELQNDDFVRSVFEQFANMAVQVEHDCLKKAFRSKFEQFKYQLLTGAIKDIDIANIEPEYPTFLKEKNDISLTT